MAYYIDTNGNKKKVAAVVQVVEVGGGGGGDVTQTNIATYKYQDVSNKIRLGGAVATNEEYEAAEEYLQGVYNLILNGGSNE